MNKIVQFIFALLCLSELARNNCKNGKRKKRGLRWIEDLIDKSAGIIIFSVLLAYSIFKGLVQIPLYMKDGVTRD